MLDQYVRDFASGRHDVEDVCVMVLDCVEEEVHHMVENCVSYFGTDSDRGKGALGLWRHFDDVFAPLRVKYDITPLELELPQH